MTSQLQQAIDLAQSLSLAEQLELLKTLSAMIQQSHDLELQSAPDDVSTDFSAESFRQSWQQAIAGQTLPLSHLVDDAEQAELEAKFGSPSNYPDEETVDMTAWVQQIIKNIKLITKES